MSELADLRKALEAKMAWAPLGNCVGLPTDTMFPEPDTSEERLAVAICTGGPRGVECPVKAECLDYALTYREGFGVWGGMGERQRRRLRRRRWQ